MCHSDDEGVLWFPFCSHSSFVDGDVIYLYVGRSVLCGAFVSVQDYRRDGSDNDRVAGEPSCKPSEGGFGHDGLRTEIVINEQTILNASQTMKEKMQQRIGKGLRSLLLKFQSPRSCPDRESRRPLLLTRSVFPVLTFIEFKGVSEYLDDLVASIDVPQLNSLYITFFNQIVFDTPQTVRFFNRTPALKSLDKARVEFGGRAAEVHLSSRAFAHEKLDVKILCRDLDWQVSSTEQVFTSCLPSVSAIEVLCIHKTPNTSLEHWPDNIENRLWLELLHPFTALKILYISKEFVPRILPALQELVGGRTTEVLPTLQNLFLERRKPSGPVQEGIGQFIAARQVASNPVVVSRWGGDSRWFDRGGDEWSWFEKRANKL